MLILVFGFDVCVAEEDDKHAEQIHQWIQHVANKVAGSKVSLP
jgi:hypothetical protein